MSSCFLLGWSATRAIRVLQVKGRLPLGGGLTLGRLHIHHYVWGVFLVLAQGALGMGSEVAVHDLRRAVPLGIGLALVADEADILLGFENWPLAGRERPVADAAVAAAAAVALGAGGWRARSGGHPAQGG